jgi:hypothetical protein
LSDKYNNKYKYLYYKYKHKYTHLKNAFSNEMYAQFGGIDPVVMRPNPIYGQPDDVTYTEVSFKSGPKPVVGESGRPQLARTGSTVGTTPIQVIKPQLPQQKSPAPPAPQNKK